MTKQFTLQWKIEPSAEGTFIRDFLKEKSISKTALTDIKFKGGQIAVNGQTVTVRYKLETDDLLVVKFPPELPSASLQGEDISLHILYEDDYLLVINKWAGMNTIPSREHPSGSLANALIGHYNKSGIQATVHIVTRLDRDTSGLVLIAKHRHIHHLFSQQQLKNEVERIYEAFAEGVISKQNGMINEPIARKEDSIIERQVHPHGKKASTHYKVINRYETYTHLELLLETGRTHQIRVHLSYIGHPLLGDELYGGSKQRISRQALHCSKISFIHPFTKERLQFCAPLQEDMRILQKNEK